MLYKVCLLGGIFYGKAIFCFCCVGFSRHSCSVRGFCAYFVKVGRRAGILLAGRLRLVFCGLRRLCDMLIETPSGLSARKRKYRRRYLHVDYNRRFPAHKG